MTLPEPHSTSIDVRGRFLGEPLRIHPMFWLAAGAMGVRYIADPEAGSLGYFSFWIAAALFSVLLHALAQAFVGRAFGVRSSIILYWFGCLVLGMESLPRFWRRGCVLLAGPLMQALILLVLWGLAEILPFPAFLAAWGWQSAVATGATMLVDLNVNWLLLSILPIWPLTGGRIVVDLGETLLEGKGRRLALVLSLLTIGLLSVWVVSRTVLLLNNPFDPRYPLYLSEGTIGLAFCFLLWLANFKALWPVGSEDVELKSGT